MTNTERLEREFLLCQKAEVPCRFRVGKYTGNGPSVVAALRRRGYTVERLQPASYAIISAP